MREITYQEAINEALHEEMARDDTIFIMGESISHDIWETHEGLAARFGKERIRDTAISEAAIVGAAVGAALAGYRPIADIMFADFLFCAADETINIEDFFSINKIINCNNQILLCKVLKKILVHLTCYDCTFQN